MSKTQTELQKELNPDLMDTEGMGLLESLAKGNPIVGANVAVRQKQENTAVTIIDTDEIEELKHSKSTIREAMDIGLDVLKTTKVLVDATDDAKIISSVPALIKGIVDAAKAMQDLNVKKTESKQEQTPKNVQNNINQTNNVFNGSPAELQKQLDRDSKTIDVEFEEIEKE